MRKRSYNRSNHSGARIGRTVALTSVVFLAVLAFFLLITPVGKEFLTLLSPEEEQLYSAGTILSATKDSDSVPAFSSFPSTRQPLDIGAPDFNIGSKSVLLIDIKTGDILYEKAADETIYPASTTKIMSALLFVENITDMSQIITADADIITGFYGTAASNADIIPNEQLSLGDLLHCILLPSGNEASAIAARYISGSEEAFAVRMTERANELGATHTNFTNSHGLHDDNHYTTARDLAIIAQAFWQRTALREIAGLYSYTLSPTDKREARDIYSTLLMQNPNSEYYYEPIRGIKTGTTTQAGRCFVSVGEKGGRQLLLVAMNAPYRDDAGNILQGANQAFTDTKNIYEWAFSQLAAQGKLK